MACALTIGRGIGCKDAVGGLKAVYFGNFDSVGTVTYDGTDTDKITTFGSATATWFKYDLKGVNTFEQKITVNQDNRTSFIEQTLSITLAKLDVASHKELKLLMFARTHCVIETNAGDFNIMGLEYGAEVSDGGANIGAKLGDENGYKLVVTAQEKTFANFITTSLTAALTAGATISSSQTTP